PTATPALHTLSLHDALPISPPSRHDPVSGRRLGASALLRDPRHAHRAGGARPAVRARHAVARVSRPLRPARAPRALDAARLALRPEEHSSELQSRGSLVFPL